MKFANLKKTLITASILAAVGHGSIALAHSGGGNYLIPPEIMQVQPILRRLIVLRGKWSTAPS